MTVSTTHELKTWPVYFQRVWEGEKTFEVRLDDRGFQKGDTVVLREWDPRADCACTSARDHEADCAKYSGRKITARIGFVMASTPARGSQRGFVGMGYVVFSLVDPANHDGRTARPAPVTPGAVTPGTVAEQLGVIRPGRPDTRPAAG